MTIPADRETFDGELASYWFDNDGILVSLSKSPRRTVVNTTENFALVKRITNNKKVPLLVYLSSSSAPDKQTREFVAKELPNVYTRMAIVSKSHLGKIIMNALFKLKPPAIPMKNFTDDKEAKEWLKRYL